MRLPAMRTKKSEGFTIIEVLIVLAIAGLIMVVVFIAVPALQRQGRNNALNTSANNVLTAVGNYVSNNNGTLPGSVSLSGTTVTISGPQGSSANTETANVDSGVAAASLKGSSQAITKDSTLGTIQVVTGTSAKCDATASGLASGTTASPRSYAVLYVAEGGSGNIVKCIGG